MFLLWFLRAFFYHQNISKLWTYGLCCRLDTLHPDRVFHPRHVPHESRHRATWAPRASASRWFEKVGDHGWPPIKIGVSTGSTAYSPLMSTGFYYETTGSSRSTWKDYEKWIYWIYWYSPLRKVERSKFGAICSRSLAIILCLCYGPLMGPSFQVDEYSIIFIYTQSIHI